LLLVVTLAAQQFHDIILTLNVPTATATFLARRLNDLLPIYAPLLGIAAADLEDAVVTVQPTPDGAEGEYDDHYLGQLLEEGGAA
jgi:hypothetical protein